MILTESDISIIKLKQCKHVSEQFTERALQTRNII